MQQSLIELAKWHKDYVKQAPAMAEGRSPIAEEVMGICLKHLDTYFKAKKLCMPGNVVSEMARYLSANLALRERYPQECFKIFFLPQNILIFSLSQFMQSTESKVQLALVLH
jgi:hypothetical protein